MTGTGGAPQRPVPEDLEDLDPGLARERTLLAWRRTAISFTAVSAGVLKFAPLAGAPLLVMAVAVSAVSTRYVRVGFHTASSPSRRRAVRLIALTTALTALTALGVAFFAHSHPVTPSPR